VRPAMAARAGRHEAMPTEPPDDPEGDDPEEEVYPPDFIYALIDFIEDVCRIEAHVWAAEQALRDARVIDERHLADGGLEATLGRERAYFLMDSVADAAEEAAERAHKLRPELVAYCARQRVELWRKLDAEDEARQAGKVADIAPEAGNVAESGEAPAIGEPKDRGGKPRQAPTPDREGRRGRKK
jgi:hypothetical protein